MNKSNANAANVKKVKTEDILNYLAGGFLRGNIGFLKSNTTERIKGPTTVQREIRIGVTHVRNKKIKNFLTKNKTIYYIDLCRINSCSWYIMD
jgi:hypothetical protein